MLTAAAFGVIVSVLALAIGAHWAAVIYVVAQLPDVFYHHGYTVGVALAKVPATGIVGAFSTEAHGAITDIFAALALLAKTVIFEL